MKVDLKPIMYDVKNDFSFRVNEVKARHSDGTLMKLCNLDDEDLWETKVNKLRKRYFEMFHIFFTRLFEIDYEEFTKCLPIIDSKIREITLNLTQLRKNSALWDKIPIKSLS